MNPLSIDTVIDLQQQIAFFDLHKVLNLHLGDIAVHLRADKRRLAAHVGVIGKLRVTGERRQLPRIKDHQHADNTDGGGGENGNNAHIFAGVGLLFGGILLTHKLSRTLSIICCRWRSSAPDGQ